MRSGDTVNWLDRPLRRFDERLAVAESLGGELRARFAPPKILRVKVAAGELGRKSGTGFYQW